MRCFSALTSFALLSLHIQPILAYWRMACSVSQTSRIDPILAPDSIAGHVHKFAGGSNVNQASTHDSLLASTCSTCEVQDDKSAYWTPQLYYEHADGTIEEVQNDGMTVYYVGRGGDSSNTVPFPVGFKMITGNSLARHYDDQNLTYMNTRPIADRVSFRCINEANNIPETHYIHETNCVNGLRAQINFQSCWDGVNLYKAGNTHVAYLSGIDYGVCPPTHPVPVPGLFFEVLYWTDRVDQGDGGRFVFSNGDTTGFGFHGDFLNGWNQDVQTRAVQQCLYVDNGGVVSACPTLATNANQNFERICPESPQAVSEAVSGQLPDNRLPGCNPITSGPADAPQVVCAVNSTNPIEPPPPAVSTTITPYPNSTLLSTVQSSLTSLTTIFSSSGALSISTTMLPTITASAANTTSVDTSGSPAVSFNTRTSTRQTGSRQSDGGIFVTVASNTTTPASTSVQGFSATAIDNITVTMLATTDTSNTFSTQPLYSVALNSSMTASTFNSTTSVMITNATTGAETSTAFVTIYSPVTVSITSVTDVTVIATPLPRRERRDEPATIWIRGREVVRRR